jgi:hypothetical protein
MVFQPRLHHLMISPRLPQYVPPSVSPLPRGGADDVRRDPHTGDPPLKILFVKYTSESCASLIHVQLFIRLSRYAAARTR